MVVPSLSDDDRRVGESALGRPGRGEQMIGLGLVHPTIQGPTSDSRRAPGVCSERLPDWWHTRLLGSLTLADQSVPCQDREPEFEFQHPNGRVSPLRAGWRVREVKSSPTRLAQSKRSVVAIAILHQDRG